MRRLQQEVLLIRVLLVLPLSFFADPATLSAQNTPGSAAVDELKAWLNNQPLDDKTLGSLEQQSFSSVAITKDDCQQVQSLLTEARAK